jgi:DNA-binding response OmpR family regulator
MSMNNQASWILVVDDDPDISMMLKMMLEYKGYKVITADRLDDIFRAISSHSFNLIIMDMLLSGINGTDICAKLKAEEDTCSIPVMMISAHPNARELCIKAGANDFMAKPFDMDDILKTVGRLASSKSH